MSYLLTYYPVGTRHHCRLARENGQQIEHVLSALFTGGELDAFIQMLKKLDPTTQVEQSPVPGPGQGALPFLNRRGM